MIKYSNHLLAASLLPAACLLAMTQSSHALSFKVDLDVSTLAANAGTDGPFALDFTISGTHDSAYIHGVSITGGIFDSASISTTGPASGDLASPTAAVSILSNASNAFNDFSEAFGPNTTDIKFTAEVSQLSSTDTFTFGILDNTGNLVATTDPSGINNLGEVDITPTISLASVKKFTTTAEGTVTPLVTVPEPSTVAALLGGVAMLVGLRRRRA